MARNAALRKADRVKNDEFYTRLVDIENELRHYKDFLRNKVVLCNCDDPFESNFFKYFAMNFNHLGLKKLICTSYAGSPISYTELSDLPLFDQNKMPYMIEITEVADYNSDGAEDMTDIEYLLRNNKNTLTILDGDGDFRSEECIGFLKEADVIVTNPPFSLFREFVAQLIEYKKKFIIIGNSNALTYKEIFPYIKNNDLWLGYNAVHTFIVPTEYTNTSTFVENETKYAKFGNVGWFTNVDIDKRHDELVLYKHYSPDAYPRYDNYDAINVDKVVEIPEDYTEKMGVPITFLNYYNPEQFEIIDGIGRYSVLDNETTKKAKKYLSMIDGKAKYFRYIIKNLHPKTKEEK